MSDIEIDYIDTRNTKLNDKYQTKVYYRTLEDNDVLTEDCRSRHDLLYETICPSCRCIGKDYKKTGRKCEHGHNFYISPVEKPLYEVRIIERVCYSCDCSFNYTEKFQDTVCSHGNVFGARKSYYQSERHIISTCDHGCTNISNKKCPHGFRAKQIDYEKLNFNAYIYPLGKPKHNISGPASFIDRDKTKVKGIREYSTGTNNCQLISIPSTRTKNPNETYESFSDILGNETKVYRIGKNISMAEKYSTGTYIGNTNKRETYRIYEGGRYNESKSERNALIHTKNLIYTNNELIIEERFKPLDDRVDGRRGKTSRKVAGKKIDDFEKGKYTHNRTRV